MSMYRGISWVVGKGCLLRPPCSFDKTLLAFALIHFVLQHQTCLLFLVTLDFLLLHSSPLWWKWPLFWVSVLEDVVGLHQFCSSVMSDSLRPHGLQHSRLPCPSPTPGACSNLCPSSRWCHPTISSSVVPFSSCFQSFSSYYLVNLTYKSFEGWVYIYFTYLIHCLTETSTK